MKLHICAGDIYLKGYTNIDIQGKFAKANRPNRNATTLEKYYKYPFNKAEDRKNRGFIIDTQMNILEPWIFGNCSVEEIVMISAFEHFTPTQRDFILSEVWRVLKPKGAFKFDFPDIRETVRQYYDNDPEFCMNLIYCNHKNEHSVHHWGYTEKSIQKLLTKNGFGVIMNETVKHDYPMIGVWGIKK